MTTLVNSLSLRSFIRALQLIKYADRPAKRRLFLLIPIGLLSALAETAGLISIFPLLALLSDPSYIYSNKYLRTFVRLSVVKVKINTKVWWWISKKF